MEILEMRLDAFGEKISLRLCGVTELCHVAGASRYDHDILPESRRGREQEQQCQSQRPGHVNSERWDGDQCMARPVHGRIGRYKFPIRDSRRSIRLPLHDRKITCKSVLLPSLRGKVRAGEGRSPIAG